jgi:hypothetical protein
MPNLVKSITANIIEITDGDVQYINSVSAELQREDYIDLNGFMAFLQDFSKTEDTSLMQKPLVFGLKNKYNLNTVTLNIDK